MTGDSFSPSRLGEPAGLEEGVGDHGDEALTVKAGPRSSLEVIEPRVFPPASSPGILDRLNTLGLSCRCLPLDKEDARRTLTQIRRRWFSKRKGVVSLIKEAITREPFALEDPNEAAKTEDADAALAILGADAASRGYSRRQ